MTVMKSNKMIVSFAVLLQLFLATSCLGYGVRPVGTPEKETEEVNADTNSEDPWHVSIFYLENQKSGPSKYKYKCGGTLISSHTVLTAAHCGENERGRNLNSKDFLVTIGSPKSFNLETTERDGHHSFTVEKFLKMDEYNGRYAGFNFDVGLLILNNPVTLAKGATFPARVSSLPRQFQETGARARVPGWGLTGSANSTEQFRYAELPFLAKDKCKKLLTDDERRLLTFDKFCCGYDVVREHQCESGGGLTFKNGDEVQLIGVVSGTITKSNTFVTFFTSIDYHKDWIQNNLK